MVVLKSETDNEDEVGLQSSESKAGLNLSTAEILEFSEQYSEYVNLLVPILADAIRINFDYRMPVQSIEILVRRALVPIVFFYWNQVVRVNKYLNQVSDVVAFSLTNDLETQETPESFEAKAISKEWNEWILRFIASIWSLPTISEKPSNQISENRSQKLAKNYLFFLGGFSEYKSRLIIRLEKVFDKISFLSKYPILTFANAEPALRLKGLYLFQFRKLARNFTLKEHTPNIGLREKAFEIQILKSDQFSNYLKALGFSELQMEKAFALFHKFLIRHFPLQSLEGMQTNYDAVSQLFKKNDRKLLLSSGDGDVFSTFTIAWAKGNQFKIVKAQHGGHYGYYKDNRPALDIELPATDIFITWGWTRMHEGEQLKHIKTVPLPSPWLSERKRLWNQLTKSSAYDLLWMPQMMKRFIGSPQGASSIRRDVLVEFSEMMIQLGNQLELNQIRTIIKPYNLISVQLMSKAYSELRSQKKYITVLDTFDKGLTVDLLQKSSIVIWDQPGTGFMECLSSGIPTVLYWNRIFCEEEEWTKEDFHKLEKVGIIHRTLESVVATLKEVKKDPVRWMNEDIRKSVVSSFCATYARTSDNWAEEWKLAFRNMESLSNS